MRTQVKIVRFAAVTSAIFAIITYLITLNMENRFITLNTPWLSNNFALTVCGGAFASMLVVLVCEVQKYLLEKQNAEDQIYTHVAYIFAQLHIMKANIQSCVVKPSQTVPGQLLAYSTGIIRNEISLVANVNYVTLTESKLVKEYQALCQIAFQHIENYAVSTSNLDIAVKMDQINNLQFYGVERPVTSQSYYTHQTLDILSRNLAPLPAEIDSFLSKLDRICKNRYQWSSRRDAMLAACDATTPNGFEEFIKQGSVQK